MIRLDRGLSPVEQDALSHWLASSPRHGEALRKFGGSWKRLDRLGRWLPEHSQQPNPDLLAPSFRQRFIRVMPIAVPLAAVAAVVVIGLFLSSSNSQIAAPKVQVASKPAPDDLRRVLEDGSVIELNTGAVITVQYTATERKVLLERGEAHFAVAKNPQRPFVVNAHGVNVHAVGTAFNVRMDSAVVEVLVTEGRVQLTTPVTESRRDEGVESVGPQIEQAVSVLDARQRAVISLSEPSRPPQIAALTTGEIQRVLAWQHRLLEFSATPLAEIVAEFNRRNDVQIVLADRELAAIPVSASFRSDNIEGFVQLMESGFQVQVERRDSKEIVLHKSP